MILCATVDQAGRNLATTAEDKHLKIWQIDGLKLLNSRELPKRPTAIHFTKDGETVLVADKFGDIFSYPSSPSPIVLPQKRDVLSSHENPSGGQLLLGHTSLLTDFCLTLDEKYIITSDRDEHIRVSWYPQSYVIESFCLGHKKFVSSLHIPPSQPSQLISGGGDHSLKVWDWLTGTLQHEIRIDQVVLPYIKVTPSETNRGVDEGEENEKSSGRRKKGKGKKAESEEPVEEVHQAGSEPHSNSDNSSFPEPVLAIGRIGTLQNSSQTYIIWSAIGASALFASLYSVADNALSKPFAFDFGIPVTQFTIIDDRIWVLLDSTYSHGERNLPTTRRGVRILTISSAQLTEVTQDLPLLSALNEKHCITATEQELTSLGLYSGLNTLPKRSIFDSRPTEEEASETQVVSPGGNENTKVSKKQLGRQKRKKAVALILTGEQAPSTDAPGSKRAKSKFGVGMETGS